MSVHKDPSERRRTVQIKFWATPEERELIQRKLEISRITNMGAYLRKMAIDGYVIRLELPELTEMVRLLGIANNNINQIARTLHTTGRVYEDDIKEIQTRIDGLYEEARKILNQLSMIT